MICSRDFSDKALLIGISLLIFGIDLGMVGLGVCLLVCSNR